MNKVVYINMLYHELHWGHKGAEFLLEGRGPLSPLGTTPVCNVM